MSKRRSPEQKLDGLQHRFLDAARFYGGTPPLYAVSFQGISVQANDTAELWDKWLDRFQERTP